MVSRGPLTLPQIAERLGLSVDNTRVVLLRMLRAGQIARAKDEGQMRWFPRLEVRS
jgi:DNA-binding transcriptional regulator GbsR (MarR family)